MSGAPIPSCSSTDCVSYVYEQHRVYLSGIDSWDRPAGAAMVTVQCKTVGDTGDPPTITDADLNVTPLFANEVDTWETGDGSPLSGTFTVTTNANDEVIILWVEVS